MTVNWYERRTLALKIADATTGYDRVPAPERTVSLHPQPYITNTGLTISRQQRREQDRKEAKEHVLSKKLEVALGQCLPKHPALLMSIEPTSGRRKYTPAMVSEDSKTWMRIQ
jgi:hypothetical protein